MWKWTSSLFMSALLWEMVITLVFWFLLFPNSDYSSVTGMNYLLMYINHTVPLLVLLIDFCFNAIWFEKHQVWPNLAVFLLYGLLNIGLTYFSGHPVYSLLSWDSTLAWIVGLSLLPIVGIIWMILCLITHFKFKKLQVAE